MDQQRILEELLDLAEQVGFVVRREFLGGEGGGLCRLRGKWVLFIDSEATVADQTAQTAEALAGREEIEQKYLLPQVREILDQYR